MSEVLGQMTAAKLTDKTTESQTEQKLKAMLIFSNKKMTRAFLLQGRKRIKEKLRVELLQNVALFVSRCCFVALETLDVQVVGLDLRCAFLTKFV